MAKAPSSQEKVARLKALRDDPHSPAAQAEIKKALRDRSNFVVARSAELIGEWQLRPLIPDLLAAFDRFMADQVKTDPQCLAKAAVAEALTKLEHDDRSFFLKGLRYVQLEPAWGGERDSAAQLRGICAFGLVQSSWGDALEVLNHLTDLLADPEKPARINAARAIAQYSRREGIPLLRLKVRTDDEDPEVIGECFSALLSLAGSEAVSLIAEFLQSPDTGLRLEAAAALGESREPEAFAALKHCWETSSDSSFKRSLLISIGLSRQPPALEFLLALVRGKDLENACAALEGLAPSRFHEAIREKVAAAVKENAHPDCQKVFEKVFSAD
jgi:HEAT repeat protein